MKLFKLLCIILIFVCFCAPNFLRALSPISCTNCLEVEVNNSLQRTKYERVHNIVSWIIENRSDLLELVPLYIRNEIFEGDYENFILSGYFELWKELLMPNSYYCQIYKNQDNLLSLVDGDRIWTQILKKRILECKAFNQILIEIQNEYSTEAPPSGFTSGNIYLMYRSALIYIQKKLIKNSNFIINSNDIKYLNSLLNGNNIWQSILIKRSIENKTFEQISREIMNEYPDSFIDKQLDYKGCILIYKNAMYTLQKNLRRDSDYQIVKMNKNRLTQLLYGDKILADLLIKRVIEAKSEKQTLEELREQYKDLTFNIKTFSYKKKRALVRLRQNLAPDSLYNIILSNIESLTELVGGDPIWAKILIMIDVEGKTATQTAIDIKQQFKEKFSNDSKFDHARVSMIRKRALVALQTNLRKDSDYNLVKMHKKSLVKLVGGDESLAEILIKKILYAKSDKETAQEINEKIPGKKLKAGQISLFRKKALLNLYNNLNNISEYELVKKNEKELLPLVGGNFLWKDLLVKLILEKKKQVIVADEIRAKYPDVKLNASDVNKVKINALTTIHQNLKEDSDYNIIKKHKNELPSLVEGNLVWSQTLIKIILEGKSRNQAVHELTEEFPGIKVTVDSISTVLKQALEPLYRNINQNSEYQLIKNNFNYLQALVGGNPVWADVLVKKILENKNRKTIEKEINKKYSHLNFNEQSISKICEMALQALYENLQENSDFSIVKKNKDKIIDLLNGRKHWADILINNVLEGKSYETISAELILKYPEMKFSPSNISTQKILALELLLRNLYKKEIENSIADGINIQSENFEENNFLVSQILKSRKSFEYYLVLNNKENLISLLNGDKFLADLLIKNILEEKSLSEISDDISMKKERRASIQIISYHKNKALSLLMSNISEGSDYWLKHNLIKTSEAKHYNIYTLREIYLDCLIRQQSSLLITVNKVLQVGFDIEVHDMVDALVDSENRFSYLNDDRKFGFENENLIVASTEFAPEKLFDRKTIFAQFNHLIENLDDFENKIALQIANGYDDTLILYETGASLEEILNVRKYLQHGLYQFVDTDRYRNSA